MKITVVIILLLTVFILKLQMSRSIFNLEEGEREVREIKRRITEEHLPVLKSDIKELPDDFSKGLRDSLSEFSRTVSCMSLHEAQRKITSIHENTEKEAHINKEKLEKANTGYNIILCLCAFISIVILF